MCFICALCPVICAFTVTKISEFFWEVAGVCSAPLNAAIQERGRKAFELSMHSVLILPCSCKQKTTISNWSGQKQFVLFLIYGLPILWTSEYVFYTIFQEKRDYMWFILRTYKIYILFFTLFKFFILITYNPWFKAHSSNGCVNGTGEGMIAIRVHPHFSRREWEHNSTYRRIIVVSKYIFIIILKMYYYFVYTSVKFLKYYIIVITYT